MTNSSYKLSFDISDMNKVAEAYDIFTKNFYTPFAHAPQYIDRERLNLKTADLIFLQKLANRDYWAGIDLPVLLTGTVRSSSTVLIIAEDPLRDECHEGIVLSSPFGVHLERCRNGRQRIYWDVIEYLISMDQNVYLTDVNKLWLKHKDRPKEIIPADLSEKFSDTLLLELKYFNPRLIITYGKHAEMAMNRFPEYLVRARSFVHPAGSANKEWKKVLVSFFNNDDARCNRENKLAFIKSKVGEVLD